MVALNDGSRPLHLEEIVADAQRLHMDRAHVNALFQVASQFNLLEMTSPRITPESGIGRYEFDATQGPACAIAAGAGTIYRNYFAAVGERIGQSADRQIDCLADVGNLLGNDDQRLWRMVNGYALPSSDGLKEINQKVASMNGPQREAVKAALRIGIQWNTQVTLEGATHLVTQAYCSAMPVSYAAHSEELWEPFATLVLEAAYEATIAAARLNAARTGSRQLFLTLLGGGAFGNRLDWILRALRQALLLHSNSGLMVVIVSHRHSNPLLRPLIGEFG